MNSLLGSARNAVDSGAYSDINRLSQLKGKDRDSEANVRKVAQEFESLFLNQMLKSMRSASEVLSEGNDLTQSETTKQYQDMYDQQLSVSLSKQGGGIGLADMLVRQMAKDKTGGDRPNPFAQTAADAVPTAAVDHTARPLPDGVAGRDDRSALNLRRLALPGRLAPRQAAAEAPAAEASAEAALAASATQPSTHEPRPLVDLGYRAPRPMPVSQLPTRATYNGVAGADLKQRFETPEAFVAAMMPMAEQAAQRLGVEPRYLVAQAALETGWGKSIIQHGDGRSSHNLFGIKAHGWGGDSMRVNTREYVAGTAVTEKASFRSYGSFRDSFNDYVSFLQSNGRYRHALGATSSEQFVRELQKAGYATDPNYASKINQIARQMQTYQTIAAAGVSSTNG